MERGQRKKATTKGGKEGKELLHGETSKKCLKNQKLQEFNSGDGQEKLTEEPLEKGRGGNGKKLNEGVKSSLQRGTNFLAREKKNTSGKRGHLAKERKKDQQKS